MRRKLSRLLCIVIAAFLDVTALPLNSIVSAATGTVYYFYDDLNEDYIVEDHNYNDFTPEGMGTTIPEGFKRVGVFVNGGSFTASACDKYIYANNATVNAQAVDFEKSKLVITGSGSIITSKIKVTSDESAYIGNIDFESVYEYYDFELDFRPNYEFTSDYVIKESLSAKKVIIDSGVTVKIDSALDEYDDFNHRNSNWLSVIDNITINGTLTFGEIGSGIVGNNCLNLYYGTIILGSQGKIVGVNGACIATQSPVNDSVFDFYMKDDNGSTVPADDKVFGEFIYNSSENKWICSYYSGYFDIMFDDFSLEYSNWKPTAFVKLNGNDIANYQKTSFAANQQLNFELIVPPKRAGETPLVTIRNYRWNVVSNPQLTKTANGYTFTLTPSSDEGFLIEVNWSEYDRIEPGENQFMLEIESQGALSYQINPIDNVYPEPHSSKCIKYIYDEDVLNDGIEITITLESGHDLACVELLSEPYYYYDIDQALENDPHFTRTSSGYKYTINLDNIGEWKYNDLKFVADDSDDYYDDEQFRVNADTFYYGEGTPDALVYVNGELQYEWEQGYNFEANVPVEFELTPPWWRQYNGVTPIVEIKQGGKIYSTEATGDNKIDVTPVTGKDYTYSVSFTPATINGFTVDIYWSEYDRVRKDEGDVCVIIRADEYKPYTFIDQPDVSIESPGDSNTNKYLIKENNVPQNGIRIKLESDENKILAVEDFISGIRYVPDDVDTEGIESIIHFSDSPLFSKVGGYLYLTVPSESGDYDYSLTYHEHTGNPFNVADGTYQVIYEQKFDDDGNPECYVEVNGSVVGFDTATDFEVGEDLVFTLHAPANRQGLARNIRIVNDDETFCTTDGSDGNKLVVTNDQFTFTPSSESGFIVYIDWCDYDCIWPNDDGSNIWIQTHAFDRASINVSDYYYSATDPTNAKDHKYLVARSVFDNNGYVGISFIPDNANELMAVFIEDDVYVESANEMYPDAKLMSSNPNFVKENGIWTYKITSFNKEHVHYHINAAFSSNSEPAKVLATSIALNDRIGINYYLYLPDELASDTGAYAEVNGVRCEIGSKDSSGRYPVRASVAVAEMRDNLQLFIFRGNGTLYPLMDKAGNDASYTGFNYSVAQYINESNNSGESLTVLLKRMADFGKYAQVFFDYNEAAGSYSDIASAVSGVTSNDLHRYKDSVVTSGIGITRTGSTLELNTSTVINHKFSLDSGKSINSFKYYVDGNLVTTSSTGKYGLRYDNKSARVVLSIKQIAAAELQKSHTVVVTDLDGNEIIRIENYSALSYVYSVLSSAEADSSNESANHNLVMLLKAMYLYNRAAMQYFHVSEPTAAKRSVAKTVDEAEDPVEDTQGEPAEPAAEPEADPAEEPKEPAEPAKDSVSASQGPAEADPNVADAETKDEDEVTAGEPAEPQAPASEDQGGEEPAQEEPPVKEPAPAAPASDDGSGSESEDVT